MNDALKLIIARSLNLQANIINYEIGHNADDKYMDANLELAEEMLIEAINEYVDFSMNHPDKGAWVDEPTKFKHEDMPCHLDVVIESDVVMEYSASPGGPVQRVYSQPDPVTGRCADYPNCRLCGPR